MVAQLVGCVLDVYEYIEDQKVVLVVVVSIDKAP